MSEMNAIIVDALYQGILGRAPESGAVEGTSAWLDNHGVKNALTPMVKNFVSSPEFRHRVNVTGFLADTPQPYWPDRPPYRHVVSLGSNCYPSQMLKGQGLKRYSGPFDWVFSTPAMVEHCLRDDFHTLLDRSLMEALPERSGAVGLERSEHVFYRDRFGVPKMFNHHDMTLSADYLYLCRCVERLQGVLRRDEPTLYMVLVRDDSDAAIAELLSLGATLRRIAPNSDLLAIQVMKPASGMFSFGMQVVHDQKGQLVVRFSPTSMMHSLSFDDPFNDMLVHRLIRSFRFDLSPA